MSRRPRRNHSAEFKAKVALAAVKEGREDAGRVGRAVRRVRPESAKPILPSRSGC